MRLDVAHNSGGILNRALVAFGVACLLIYALALSQTAMYQRKAKAEIDERISAHRLDAPPLASSSDAWLETTHGAPDAIASITGMPKPSNREGYTNTVAPR